ncbi:MAG: dihydrofolate reductase [Paludibacteraceae bacterium]|nr:dihydrofolate reductase [Paludibacteraceae bacterium]
MISIIVAIDEHNAIGRRGELLCHLPDDLRHFKQVTAGATVIMGERTFFSLPRHPLPNRRNIVLTDVPGKTFEGAEVAYSIDEALRMADADRENFIIGGGMIYRQFFPLADKLYITHIEHTFDDADTFFPLITEDEWRPLTPDTATHGIAAHNADDCHPFPFRFAEYLRRT